MSLTPKQLAIMKVIVTGNGTNEKGEFQPADLDQILERLEYKTTKQSIQFSIRALMNRDLIYKLGAERRRARRRQCIAPTTLGVQMLATATTASHSAELEITDEIENSAGEPASLKTETPFSAAAPVLLETIEGETLLPAASLDFEEINPSDLGR